MRRAPLLAVGIGALVLAVSYRASSDGRRPMPRPTENPLEEEAEERNREAREAWFEEMHRAPGGTDWRKVEAANGRDEVLRRNARKGAPPPPAGAASWVERGSDNQAGRVHAARPSSDGTAIYAGSDLGGLWRRDIATGTWTPLGDNLYGGAHHVLALPPAGAGDPDVLLVASDSALIHRSDDDGASWTEPSGLPEFQNVATLIETSDGTHAVFLACSQPGGGAWIARSLDGGATFTTVRDLGNFKGSVWTPRDGSSHRLYVVDDGEILTSDDLGDHWDVVGDIGVSGGRGAITGSEAGAPTLWVVLDSRDLYRSDDAGKTWIPLGAIEDYWDTTFAGSIGDPSIVAYGGVELHRSVTGGAMFRVVNRWDEYYGSPADKLHADLFGLEVIEDAKGGERWLIGTDGGLYESTDRLDTVQNLALSGLRISQYYSTLTSAADPSHVAAGAQDQGYQLTNDLAQSDDLWSFEQAISGDYGHLSSADGTHAWVFSTYPGFILVQEGETEPFLYYQNFPDTLESSAWIPPVVADPREPENFFFAGDRLWYYEHTGAQWEPSRWSDQDFQVDQGEYLSALAFAPGDPDRAYGVSSRGRLYWSDDAGVNWTATKTVAFFDYLYGATIAVSPADPDVATVGGSGYGAPPVFRTEDGGRSWFEYSEGLPNTTVYAIAESLDHRGTLVAGTQTGAWRRDAGDDEWREIAEAPAPVTTYWSVEALHSERTFRFGTYGRGIWDYRLEASDACWPVTDEDGDGVGCDRDCDDADASISPDLEEKCDGVDVNCDSTDVDENDGDGDGKPACDDCDDSDPTDASCEPAGGGEGGGGGGDDTSGGCSCATTSPGYGGAIALLGALWALRRRRR